MSFPTIAHFRGSHMSPGDVRLAPEDERAFFTRPVVVYEKLDGINVMLHVRRRSVDVEIKPKWRQAAGPRRGAELFARLHSATLRKNLPLHSILVVEWMHHRLTVPYDLLPDVAIAIAVVEGDHFIDEAARARLMQRCELANNAPIYRGPLQDGPALRALAGRSRYGSCKGEGLIVERADRWGKWVQAGFRQKSWRDVGENYNFYKRAV